MVLVTFDRQILSGLVQWSDVLCGLHTVLSPTQGSVLGPRLFVLNLYTADLVEVTDQYDENVHLYTYKLTVAKILYTESNNNLTSIFVKEFV